MKIWFQCLILILLITGVTPTFAGTSDGPIVDRKAVFEKAYQILPVVMEHATDMGMVNNDMNGREMEAYRKIRTVIHSDFESRKTDRLQFSDDQELFKLDPSQPIRTAVTSSDPSDPIFINLKVINAPGNQFQLEDALQILVHEYGHKTADKDQAIVDSVATRIRTFITGHITRSITDRGETLTSVGLQTLFGREGVNNLIRNRTEKEKMLLLTTLLYQNSKGVFDVTTPWSSFLAAHPGYVSLQKGILVNSGMNVLGLTFNRSEGDRIIFNVEYRTDSVASPNGRMGSGETHSNIIRQGSQDHSAEVALNRALGRIESVFMRRHLYTQPQFGAKIESFNQLDKETFRLVTKIRTPFKFGSVKLMIESASEQFSVKAKEVSRGYDQVAFEFKLPQVAQETSIMIRSFAADEQALIFFDEGVGLKLRPSQLPPGDLAFKNVYFKDGSISSDSVNPQPLESSTAQMVVVVKSPIDILEVRVGFKTNLTVLTPEGFFSSVNKPAVMPPEKIESIRSGYEVRHFDSSQFKQVRKGEVIEISIPISLYTRDISSHLPTNEKDLFIAINQGSNAIANIEVVDSSLRSIRMGGPGKFMPYILKTHWSPPAPLRAGGRFVAPSCSGLFGAH